MRCLARAEATERQEVQGLVYTVCIYDDKMCPDVKEARTATIGRTTEYSMQRQTRCMLERRECLDHWGMTQHAQCVGSNCDELAWRRRRSSFLPPDNGMCCQCLSLYLRTYVPCLPCHAGARAASRCSLSSGLRRSVPASISPPAKATSHSSRIPRALLFRHQDNPVLLNDTCPHRSPENPERMQ